MSISSPPENTSLADDSFTGIMISNKHNEIEKESIFEGTGSSEKIEQPTPEELLATIPQCFALFTAPWCGVDKMIRSLFLDISAIKSLSSKSILVIDCNELPHLADRYRIDVFPTFLLLENGVERGRKTGSISKSELLELLKEL